MFNLRCGSTRRFFQQGEPFSDYWGNFREIWLTTLPPGPPHQLDLLTNPGHGVGDDSELPDISSKFAVLTSGTRQGKLL